MKRTPLKTTLITTLYALLAALLVPLTANASDVDSYQGTWVNEALDLQSQLALHTPLAKVTFLATHNSYNSAAYTNVVSYWDPNQSRSIRDQLRMNVRAIELDVHSYFSTSGWPWQWGSELLLCHGTSDQVGCSTFDRSFRQGLNEVAQWLNNPANRNEVIIVYIEDHIANSDYGDAISAIDDTIGEHVFRPQSGGCEGIPSDLTKADVLAAGKQVLMITDGCGNGFTDWVYGGTGDSLNGYPTGSIAELGGFPDCQSRRFSRAFHDSHLTRFQEDRTVLTELFGDPGYPLTPQVMQDLMKCSVNIPGMDKLTPYDGRLRAAVWSWAESEPESHSGQACARMQPDGRWGATACDQQAYPFACHKPGTREWHLTSARGGWQEGEAACAVETNGEFEFAVPTNGYDNEMLKQQQSMYGAPYIWMNYRDRDGSGDWQANGRPTAADIGRD